MRCLPMSSRSERRPKVSASWGQDSTQAGGKIITAPVTVALTAADKTYDATTAAADASLSCVVNGLVPADAANVSCTATAGSFSVADSGAQTVTATVTDGLAGGWNPMSGDWHAGRGERIKPVVLAAISAALSAVGVDYPVDVEVFHADGRAITDELPASGTWVATRR